MTPRSRPELLIVASEETSASALSGIIVGERNLVEGFRISGTSAVSGISSQGLGVKGYCFIGNTKFSGVLNGVSLLIQEKTSIEIEKNEFLSSLVTLNFPSQRHKISVRLCRNSFKPIGSFSEEEGFVALRVGDSSSGEKGVVAEEALNLSLFYNKFDGVSLAFSLNGGDRLRARKNRFSNRQLWDARLFCPARERRAWVV